ncbi:MAG: tripartite tricarboxylate transporter permease [Chloroflexi bacterium]|nr:tripartite tricarboxylate transporter permease [Chloroflexota bacterium]
MLEAMGSGLAQVLSWPAFGLMLLGIPIGLIIGAIPGLGGNLGLALLIPFTYGMNPIQGFCLLLGMHAVVQTGGPMSSILFNAPGTGPSAADCLDGFPMAQQGKAGRAIGAALSASVIGGLVGAAGMAIFLPFVRTLILSFSPSEFFMLAVLGITFISLVSGDSLLKGLIVGALGLMLAFVGMDPQTGVVRFAFGQLFLFDGISLVPVVIGLFAGSECISMVLKGGSIVEGEAKVGDDVLDGVKDTLRNWWLVLRSSLIGYIIGVMPGLGGEVSAWVTYGHAAQSSKHPETFGKGNVEGVIAPAAAIHSKEAGALVPTVAFGIPGSSAMAILLGAFLVLGLTPGPTMLKQNLDVVWAMFWIVIIANIIGAAALLLVAKYLTLLTVLRSSLLVPFILVFVMLGSYLTNNTLADLWITVAFSIIGYAMKKYDYPRAPLVLSLVLGGLAETNFHMSMELWGPAFLLRPLTFILLLLTVTSIAYPIYRNWRKSQAAAAKAEGGAA